MRCVTPCHIKALVGSPYISLRTYQYPALPWIAKGTVLWNWFPLSLVFYLVTPTPPHDGHVLAVHALLQLRVEQPNTL